MTKPPADCIILSKGWWEHRAKRNKTIILWALARMRWIPQEGRRALIFEVIQRNKMTEVLLR